MTKNNKLSDLLTKQVQKVFGPVVSKNRKGFTETNSNHSIVLMIKLFKKS